MDSQGSFQPIVDGSFRNFGVMRSPLLGKPPRPSSRPNTGMRLTPLGSDAPTAPVVESAECHVALSNSPQLARTPSGRLGLVRNMRRSVPSPMRHSYPPDATQALGLDAQHLWSRMAELAAPEPSTPKRAQKDVRSRRIRRPADFGACLHAHSAQKRGQSCSGTMANVQGELQNVHWAAKAQAAATGARPWGNEMNQPSAGASKSSLAKTSQARCESMPPTGTSKSNSDAAAAAKAKAVATLQRLFFEEMARGSADPSGAAARALLRLSEAPEQPVAPSLETTEAAPISMVPPAEMELPAEAPEIEEVTETTSAPVAQQVPAHRPIVPQRPSDKIGLRRPRALSRVAVRS